MMLPALLLRLFPVNGIRLPKQSYPPPFSMISWSAGCTREDARRWIEANDNTADAHPLAIEGMASTRCRQRCTDARQAIRRDDMNRGMRGKAVLGETTGFAPLPSARQPST